MKNIKKVSMLLVCIVVILGVFGSMYANNLKNKLSNSSIEISNLETENQNLINKISEIKSDEVLKESDDDLGVYATFKEIASKFVELYPYFDIEKVQEKRELLDGISNSLVAESIVPNDLITSSKQLISKESNEEGEVLSSDPTFKSKYKESNLYSNVVDANKINYFSEVSYITTSSSGDTLNTVYLLFEVSLVDNDPKVTRYEVKYFK